MQEFEDQLRRTFSVLLLREMVIKMANRTWTIPIQDLQLSAKPFAEFIAALDLEPFDYLMIAMLPTAQFTVTVFNAHNDSERLYPWF
ncbi:hypothetical protein RHMOL_Rhmol09G0108600 [Rhododendron molle]|uniref:Uncharacterized protein n=1 Tax=Rhododendron molle TaxID=49168 RepID=A0ACC0MCD8_RHOML|nr:hypothetical protein RHMOL_Rhmol09G0108600 [Rhododendron molle]